MLSNILLTPFDREMRSKGYQLTRYADDWVITCTSATEARVALEAASRVLKELGVNINLVPDHGIIFAQPCQQARNSTAC